MGTLRECHWEDTHCQYSQQASTLCDIPTGHFHQVSGHSMVSWSELPFHCEHPPHTIWLPLHLWERACSTCSYPTQASFMPFCANRLLSMGKNLHKLPSSSWPSKPHSDLSFIPPDSDFWVDWLVMAWWRPMESLGPSVLYLVTHGVLDQMSAPAAAWLIHTTTVPNLGSLLALSESRH